MLGTPARRPGSGELEEIERVIDREVNPFAWRALRYGLEQDRSFLR